MNPLRRILDLFRRKPGMIGSPPSARQVSADPGLHSVDFSQRYAHELDYLVAQRMTELGIDRQRIGYRDHTRGGGWYAFFPVEGKGGSVVGPRIGVDSGVLNPDLFTPVYGREVGEKWAKTRLRDRLDAIIAHEYEESRGILHDQVVERVAETDLPIGENARRILRTIAEAEKRRR